MVEPAQTVESELSSEASGEVLASVDNSRRKRKCLWFLLNLFLTWGLMGWIVEDETILLVQDCIFIIIETVVILIWCHLDAEERHFKISKRLSIAIFLIWIVAFPVYVLKTRSPRQTLRTLVLAGVFGTLCWGAGYLGEWLGFMISSFGEWAQG